MKYSFYFLFLCLSSCQLSRNFIAPVIYHLSLMEALEYEEGLRDHYHCHAHSERLGRVNELLKVKLVMETNVLLRTRNCKRHRSDVMKLSLVASLRIQNNQNVALNDFVFFSFARQRKRRKCGVQQSS